MILKVTRKTVDGPVVDTVRVQPHRADAGHNPRLTVDAVDVVDGVPSGGYRYAVELADVTSVELVHDHDDAAGSRVANEIRG